MPFGVPDFHAFHIEQGVEYFYRNDFHTALVEFDQALQIRDSAMARFDRALALLALGRYGEGFREYPAVRGLHREELTERGQRLRERLPAWQGEPDVPIVILHEAGFGDAVQMMRLVPLVRQKARPYYVAIETPDPLRRLAAQLAPIADDYANGMWCTWFGLAAILDLTPAAVPAPPYLRAEPERMVPIVGNGGRRKIGIAWSTKFDGASEHPAARRPIPLEQFLELLDAPGCSFFSLQTQERDEARRLGVFTPELKDFADVAALAACMDAIVSIDTAALHVAGAIGHRNVFAILPWAPTWRWLLGDWYPQIKQCRAQAPGDWASAFAQIGGLP
jgi:hypothetical protein